jgi:hypothetical protein
MMDTSKLAVGHDVFIETNGGFVWGKVIEVLPTGNVVVETDPRYRGDLVTFDKDRNPVGNHYGWKMYENPLDAGIVMGLNGEYIPGSDGIYFCVERGDNYIRFTRRAEDKT